MRRSVKRQKERSPQRACWKGVCRFGQNYACVQESCCPEAEFVTERVKGLTLIRAPSMGKDKPVNIPNLARS